MKNSKTNFIVTTAILGALAGILMFIKFPIPIAPSFYKLDFSDVAALIGGFALGPLSAILICLIKNIINVIIEGTTTAFIGELSNFVMAIAISVPAAIYYKKNHTKKGAMIAMLIGTVCELIISALINYYVLIPAYVNFMNIPLQAIISMGNKIIPSVDSLFKLILFCTIPFNIIKSLLVCLITFILYKRVSPLINR